MIAAPSSALPPTNAERVSLKTTCSGDPNYFNSFDSLLVWIWGTRNPSATAPLIVDIGVGTFLTPSGFSAMCTANPSLSRGWVTLLPPRSHPVIGASQRRRIPIFAERRYDEGSGKDRYELPGLVSPGRRVRIENRQCLELRR
jgi:hypothetical protein